jgi:hypothetical protein
MLYHTIIPWSPERMRRLILSLIRSCLVPTPATSHWDAAFTVEGVKFQENAAKASRRKCQFDQMREVRGLIAR